MAASKQTRRLYFFIVFLYRPFEKLTTSAKIRLMLALLFASLLFTAIIVQQTYTPKNSLYQTAQTLEDNLHKKEKFVTAIFNDKAGFARLKTLVNDDKAALKTIRDFTT